MIVRLDDGHRRDCDGRCGARGDRVANFGEVAQVAARPLQPMATRLLQPAMSAGNLIGRLQPRMSAADVSWRLQPSVSAGDVSWRLNTMSQALRHRRRFQSVGMRHSAEMSGRFTDVGRVLTDPRFQTLRSMHRSGQLPGRLQALRQVLRRQCGGTGVGRREQRRHRHDSVRLVVGLRRWEGIFQPRRIAHGATLRPRRTHRRGIIPNPNSWTDRRVNRQEILTIPAGKVRIH